MFSSALNISTNIRAFIELLMVFRLRGRLIFELAKREVFDRYAGQVFGVLWTIGHPLIIVLIYIFIFGFVFTMRVGGTLDMPLDYTSYLLSGLIPWLIFSEVLGKASTLIVNNANVVKQVVFPVEVFPIKTVLASIGTFIIFLVLLTIYALVANGFIPWTYVLLPFLVILQTFAMIGVSYLLSAIGVYFRDLKDFVQIFNSIAFFVMPILYLPEAVPSALRLMLYLNPLSYMIWVYQDALYFGKFNHLWAWAVFGLGSLVIFILGYRVFRRLSVMFGNVL
ncbi:MAG: ABC transporter permease [Anaerolineales bacterium]|nr:ABC transporter permease [Anaerolineales bacterium]